MHEQAWHRAAPPIWAPIGQDQVCQRYEPYVLQIDSSARYSRSCLRNPRTAPNDASLCQGKEGGGFAAPVFPGGAAHGPGPSLRLQGCCAIACGDGLTAGLDPGASTAPGGRKSGRPGPAPGARGTQTQSGGAGERVLGGGARA
jgi:hypothetical protein